MAKLCGLEYGFDFIEKFVQLPFILPVPTNDDLDNYLVSITGFTRKDWTRQRPDKSLGKTGHEKDTEHETGEKIVEPHPTENSQMERRESIKIQVSEDYDTIEKVYRDNTISFWSLAQKLSVPYYQLARILNENLGKNFSDYINFYRIEEAKKILVDPKKSNQRTDAVGKPKIKSRQKIYKLFSMIYFLDQVFIKGIKFIHIKLNHHFREGKRILLDFIKIILNLISHHWRIVKHAFLFLRTIINGIKI
jgi:AraC-like DNA-binding protein